MATLRTTLPLAATLFLAGLGKGAVGADPDCDRVRWLLELDSVGEIWEGTPNEWADSWWSQATLEPLGDNGPETLGLLARDGVIYATPDALTIQAGEGVGCSKEARAYACEAGPRVNSAPYEFPLTEGEAPEGELPVDTGSEAGPNDIRITIDGDALGIRVPSPDGPYTVVYRVTGSEVF